MNKIIKLSKKCYGIFLYHFLVHILCCFCTKYVPIFDLSKSCIRFWYIFHTYFGTIMVHFLHEICTCDRRRSLRELFIKKAIPLDAGGGVRCNRDISLCRALLKVKLIRCPYTFDSYLSYVFQQSCSFLLDA